LCNRFFNFKNMEMIQWIVLILGISNFWFNSLGIQFRNFLRIFGNAWVVLIRVGVFGSKFTKMLSIIFRRVAAPVRLVSKDVNCYCAFFDIYQKCRIMSTYSNAHAKVKRWIFNVELPRNWFGLGFILLRFHITVNDF